MAQDPTSVSPGYYSATAYDVLSKYDPAFSENVSVKGFFEKLQSPEYAAKAYAILADADPELVNNLSLDEFVSNVKKKEVTAVTESVSDAGSSELLPSAELPPRFSVYGVNMFGQEVDDLGVAIPVTDSSLELMDYNRRRREAATRQDTRLADEVQAKEMERLEEERRIAAASMPAVPEVGDQMAVDYIQQLRDVYGPYGIRFETDYYDPNDKFGEIRALGIGADGNAVEFGIGVEKGKIDQSDLSGLTDFLQSNARTKGGLDVDKRSLSEKALKVQQMRPVARLNEDGIQSTVKMEDAEYDGRFFAYPTLFPTGDGFSADPKNWLELKGNAAFEEAQRRGEVFEFNTAEEANRFAKGEWKEIRETDAIAEKMWAEKGRNYYADEVFLREVEEKKKEYEFLETLTPGSTLAKGALKDRFLEDMEIPLEYQKYIITYTDDSGQKRVIARTDIEKIREQKERELAALEQQFDDDNELLRLKEDYDELLGKRRGEIMERAAALNQEGKVAQNRADVASINRFGVPVKDLMTIRPQTEGEYNEMLSLFNQYNTGIDQRRTGALLYEKNKLYYDAQHEKLINQEYVDGWEEFTSAWNWDKGVAIGKLVLINYGYYDAIGDERAEEEAMREVSARINSGEMATVGRATSRINLTGTTESFFERINPLSGGTDALVYAAALTSESLSQLLPIWAVTLPPAIAVGAGYGAAVGPGGSTFGTATTTLGAAGLGAVAAVTTVGMPVSELVLEVGNSILETGTEKGYDWADPNSALLALNDESVWEEGAKRGYQRGVPIMLTGMVSNRFMAKVGLGGSRTLPLAERLAIGVGTGVTVEPASEMFGEYLAQLASGEYTGSVANIKEITAEGLGAIGMGVGFTTSMAALGYAGDVVTDANFDLAMRLMDPEGIAKENVRGERIVSWANRMETLGKIDAEQAEAIRKNVGRRRQANELLGKKIDARPGSDSQVIGRIVELLEAKEELERSGPNVFGEKIRAITEEIALIAESGKVEKPGEAAVNLSDIRGRIRNRRPGAYKFNGKKVTREDFLSKLQEATPRQLKRARAYNDIEAQLELISRRDAIQKRKAAEVPVGEEPGVSPQVDQQVREATQEDFQAEEQGTLDLDRKAVILESIAEKLNDEVELNEVEQAFLEDNKEDIEAEQKRAIAEKLNDKTELTETEQALLENNKADIEAELKRIETFEVEVRGEPEVQGRIPLKRLKRLAANAKKAMAKNFAGANIIIHNDKASYQQAARESGLTGEGSAGFLGTDNKTVHIFAPLASETTIAHETFHVILRNSVDQAQVQELMGEFVTTLKKVIPADNPLAAKLDEFQKLYDAGQMNEEYVAEFFGELAAAYPTLDTKGKSVIARFLERLGKLLGVDLKLSPDLTKRDQQILSLLERLAGQVSRGETVTARETRELAELARSTSREQTEENLGAAEQKVSDFSMREIAGMSENGVVGHFTNEAFDKFLPKFMKTGVYGAGFYFTGSTIIGKQYGKGPNATIAFVDTNDMNLVDRDRVATPDELRTAAKWLVDNDKVFITDAMEEGINPLDAAMMNLTSTPYDTISERRAKMRDTPTLGELHTNLQANFDEFLIEDDMGVITPVFMEVYPEYQGIVNRETEGGTIVDMVIWDFDAINQNIVKPTRQFAEAAAKGKVSIADFTEIVYEPTVTPEERMAEMEEELIRTKPETEAALRAAEQRVADFSDEQIQAMADEGVIFHFGEVDITRVAPEKLKRFLKGYGFYFTNYALSDSTYRSFGDRFTMVNVDDFNLLDGDKALTREQAKLLSDAAKLELQEAEEYGDMLGFEEEQVLMSLSTVQAFDLWGRLLTKNTNGVAGKGRSFTSDMTDEQMATVTRLVQEMLGFDGIVYGRPSMVGKAGAITVVWNFPKINRAIIEPGQEPTRAAEQRAQRMDDGPPRFNEDGLPEVRAAEQRLLEEATPEWMADAFKDSDPVLRDFFVALAEQPGVRMFLNPIGGGFVYANENKGSTEVDVRTSIYMEGGAVYLDLLEVFEDKGRGAGTRFMQDFVAALDATNAESKLMAWPPKWYQQDMSEEEMQAISNRLKGFYGRFGFTPIPNSDSMTRQPGAAPVEVSQATLRVDARRAELLEEIADKRTKQQLLGNVIAQTYEFYEDKAARENLRYIEDLIDPYDDAISPDELMGRALTPEQIEAINDEYGDGLINEDGFAESFEDFVDSDIVEDYHDLVVEARENIGRLRRVEQQAQESERQTRAEESTREQKLGELEDKEMALEHILAVNKAEYGRTETDVYNQYEAYLEGRLDEADKEYLRSLALGIDVETGRVDNANDLYDVFSKFQDVRDQRNELESGAAEQRIDIDAVRTRSRAGNRVSKGLATYNVDGVAQVEEIENLTRDYVREQAPEAYIKNANVIAKYPLVRGVREFGDITTVEQADELYDIYTQQTMDNLRWMMETYPDEFSEISTLWYDGANKIANELATEFGVTPEQAAGILAALSPQKDWYQNAHLARLLLEAFADNPVMTREMVNYQRRFTKKKIQDKKKALKKARAKKGTSRAKAVVEKFNKDKARLLNDIAVAEALLEEIAALEGTEMLRAPAYMMPYYVRLHSETTKQPSYPVISPDGEMAGPALKDNGQPAKWAWGSYNEIGKGVSINLNGSPENITISLGQQHKVRNFFNNIIDPMSAEGDVTMDTHAIAVSLLKPLSTKSAEVEHNFGSKGVSNSGAKGISGTYYANQEAYQMLAEEMGLLPRQVQSVTWEAVRGLFTDKFKANKENVKAINQIWENYADGKITIDEARAQVLERAGGVNPPVWADSVQGELGRGVRESRERGAGRTGGRAAEQRVYRAGDLVNKGEPRTEAESGRSTGHFGTGFYFFGDRGTAESYAESSNKPVSELDITDYNLAPASYFLHAALQEVNKRAARTEGRHVITPEEIQYAQVAVEQGPSFKDFYYMDDALRVYKDQLLDEGTARRIAAEATRRYNEETSTEMDRFGRGTFLDSASTAVMKALGYEGVNAVGTELDNYTYGTVIYDVKTEPRAAEQRVVGPELAKVLQRYEFKSNNSLKNAELAPELRRNLKRFGYSVKQYGTRMDDFRVVSLDTGRAVDPNKLIEEGLAEGRAIAEEQRAFEAEQRARELEERIIEIYNADERPYTGKDFEARGVEQKVVVEAMAEPGTIADLVARGRELGLRDASIRSVLLKRFGKDNADAIDTALTEYFDMFRAIPEAFGNVEGGIEVGRQIYDDVRRQLDEFARPKKPGRMTKRERTDRIEELRAKFPEQKKLSDTELLRKHPRQAVAPSIAEVRAEALNLLRNNRSFNEQTTEVQEQLLVAFDKTLQTKANKQVNTLISQIRNNIRQRRKGAKNARTVQTQLRKLINEVIPRADYTKADVNRLNKLVAEVNEDNYFVKAEQVLKIVDKKREQIRQSVIKDIVKFVRDSSKKYRTKSGRIRTRTLDAPGQAFFEALLPILKAAINNDRTAIEDIAEGLNNNPAVAAAIQKYRNQEELTTREQVLVDSAAALDLVGDIVNMSLEEVEAVLEDLKITAGFSRINLKNTRMARSAEYGAMNEELSNEIRDEFPFLSNDDGSAKDRNQISADRTRINELLRSPRFKDKLEGVKQSLLQYRTTKVSELMSTWTKGLRNLGTVSNKITPWLYENVYNEVNRLNESYEAGSFAEKAKLDALANTIQGITNGYQAIVQQLYANQVLKLNVKSRQANQYNNSFNKDQLLRIYALSKNEVQQAKLEAQGFTPEVMAQVEEFLGPQLLEFADKVVDYLSNEYYESINVVYKKVNDIGLGYVDNYFPTRTVTGKVQQELLQAADFSKIFDAETSPALKERTDTKSDVDISHNVSFSQTLNNHIEQMERYKAYAEGTKKINAAFQNKHLDAVLQAFHINDYYRSMVNAAINPDSARKSSTDIRIMDKLLSNFSMAVLGFKLFQIPKQISSYITALEGYNYRTDGRVKGVDPILDRIMFNAEYASILPAVLLDLGKILLEQTPTGPVYEAVGISKTFARRLEQFRTGNIYTLESGVDTFRSPKQREDAIGKFIRSVRKAQAAGIMIGDAGAIMAYLTTYRRNIKNGMSPEQALQEFNDYNITQQSRRPGDKVPLQYEGDVFRRTFIMFGSSIIGLTNNAIVGFQNIMRDVRAGRTPSKRDVRKVWLSMFAANMAFTLIANSSILLLSDDDEERQKAYMDILVSPLNGFFMIPFIGGFAEAALKQALFGYRFKGDTGVDVLGRTYQDMQKAIKKGEYGDATISAFELMLGTNLDPFIGLYELAAGEDTDDVTYEVLGIPKSQRPKSD